ncbi:alpha carbonic anhydrase [Mycena latifolia]|nr:alpha carbonic anhydrase [Mycena latifolia]
MAYSHLLLIFTLASTFLTAAANCLYGTTFQPRAEGLVPISNFSYSGTRGPLVWAELTPAYCTCHTGRMQSPIVLTAATPTARSAPRLDVSRVAQAELENLGTTLEVALNGTLFFEGEALQLRQLHMRTPSEHRIDEEYFPLEMHMVHQAANGSLTVLALLFQLNEDGNTTALLTAFTKNLAAVRAPGTRTTTGALDFRAIAAAVAKGPLFRYAGSLTTPPCSEGVTWLVLAKRLPLDVATYNRLKTVLKFNARYSQNAPGEPNLLVVACEGEHKVAGEA